MNAPLSELGPGIWIAEGPVVPFLSFPYPTRMAVIRLADGGLFVWSPIALSPELKAAVDALGRVRFLISPNILHHLFLGEWKAAYPEAKMFASPGLRAKRKDLAFDADLGDTPDPGWAADIDQTVIRGGALTEVVFFHHASRTVIFTDFIENFPPDWFKGWKGLVAKLDGIVAPNPGAPREVRWSFLFHRRQARATLERILAWPIEKVVLAHGGLVSEDGAAFVRKAFGWLLGPPRG